MNNRIGDSLVSSGGNAELVASLVDAGVKFVLVGGLAIAWHCRDRVANDLDLLVETSPDNALRLYNALASLALPVPGPATFEKPGLRIGLQPTYCAHLLTPIPGEQTYQECEASAVGGKVEGIPVAIASVTTLIAMKERAVLVHGPQEQTRIRFVVAQAAWRLTSRWSGQLRAARSAAAQRHVRAHYSAACYIHATA